MKIHLEKDAHNKSNLRIDLTHMVYPIDKRKDISGGETANENIQRWEVAGPLCLFL